MQLVYGQDQRVTRWVAGQCGNDHPTPACASIGVERDGELVAGVYFDGRTETNVFAHIASTCKVMPAELLYVTAKFAFLELACKRMTFSVSSDNERCLSFVRSMGAEHECTLKQGKAGADIYLFVLWEDCDLFARLRKVFE